MSRMNHMRKYTVFVYISWDFDVWMKKLQYCIIKMTVNGDGGAKELLEAQAHVWRYTLNYITSMALKCAVELGIPDIISNHPKPIALPELVQALSISEEKTTQMHRLMGMLVHCGFFALEKTPQDQEEGYVLTPSSRLLTKNHGTDLSPYVLINTNAPIATSFQFMSQWFRGSDLTPFETAHGMEIWNYFGQFPDASNSFNAAMASDSKLVMPVVIKDHGEIFEGFGTLVDVGGGIGTVATAISEAFPDMRCTVLDLPHVVSNLKGSKNMDFVGGDMFESIPSADIILLKWILHDWDDEKCVQILKNCRGALSKDVQGKVIIIDIVIDGVKGKHEMMETQRCYDILMMSTAAGKERSETEWEKLFLDAGFKSYKITHGMGLRSIIEVFP